MRELTVSDAELISGAFGPGGAFVGAVTTGAGYVGHAIMTREGSASGLLAAVSVGALAGFSTGPMGVMKTTAAAISGSQLGFYTGMAEGIIENSINAAGTNYSEQ